MKELLQKNLEHQQGEILAAWKERVARLASGWQEDELHEVVEALFKAVNGYLLDEDVDAAMARLDRTIPKLQTFSWVNPKVVINALLIFRFVLLAQIIGSKDCALSSLEAFGMLNDLFNPLIMAVASEYKQQKIVNRLPDNFAASCIANLQSLSFAGVGFFVLDSELHIIYWSKGAEAIYEMSASQTLGCHISEIIPKSQGRKELMRALHSAIEENREEQLSSCRQPVKSKTVVLDIKIVPVLSDRGDAAGCTVLIHDVTELKSREVALQRYEQYFENILNDAADAIVLLDENDKISLWNKAAETVFGYTEDQVLGRSLAIIFPKDQKTRAELAEMDETVRTECVVRRHRMETVAKDGHRVLVAFTRTRLRNAEKDYIGSSVILRDITQQEQLRQQIVHSEKLSAVGTLAAGIAHEVGTPLTSISSLTQILQMKTDDEEFKAKLALIQQSIDRISRTVRTLVDFSRPSTERIEKIYLNNVVEHVLRIIKYDKRLKHQKITTLLEPNIDLVRASFDQILQVFINICLNAADAMEGKRDGMLEVKTWNDDKYVCAQIRDNGTGIKRKDLPLIFDPFFTTKKNGKGTGLGLWVSYNIIKSFSGDIKVESQPGKGTAFTIYLPRLNA